MKRLALSIVLVFLATTARAEDMPSPIRLHPERYVAIAEIEGQIQSVDFEKQFLSLQDPAGQAILLQIRPDARIIDPASRLLKWTALHRGDHLHIYYNTLDLTPIQIDILDGVTDYALGPEASWMLRVHQSNKPISSL